MIIILKRFHQTNKVTLGLLTLAEDPAKFKYYTIERPWLNNIKNKSCIPLGMYQCERTMYYGGDGVGGKQDYDSFQVLDVKNRTNIKFHKANYVKDVVGCIGIGSSCCTLTPAIYNSKKAYNSFMQNMHNVDKFQLIIV